MAYTYKINFTTPTNITIDVNIDYSQYEEFKEQSYKKKAENIEIKGFRKGQAPRSLVEPMILTEVAKEALDSLLPTVTSEIIQKEKYSVASQADYNVKEISKEKGVNYSVQFYIYLSFNLPDITKIKVKLEEAKVEPKEIDQALDDILKEWNSKESNKKYEKITDDFVKELKLPEVKTVEDLKVLAQKELLKQKKSYVEQNLFEKALEEIIDKSKISLPENVIKNIIEIETNHLNEHLKAENKTIEDYAKANKMTVKEIEDGWVKMYGSDIKKRLVLSEYGKENNIQVPKEVYQAFSEKYKDQKQLFSAIDNVYLELCANALWNEIKKVNKIFSGKKDEEK